ncbi:hypothetical protein BKA69DRAFT_1094446 [Paraphysoderma sedebokerense]|nr:hypothetical protein BKA69DRAFT_1094446 [Paraphysoderma sedebokerense]
MVLFNYLIRADTPISQLRGVGKVFLEILHDAKIETVGDPRHSTVSARGCNRKTTTEGSRHC